jgi:tyrosine-protein phosphatase YwqE
LYHANLGSFTGFYGPKVQRNAYELLKLGTYTALASDLHESRSAADVLVQDKFENNPFLKKMAEFDGIAPKIQKDIKLGEGEQIGLF